MQKKLERLYRLFSQLSEIYVQDDFSFGEFHDYDVNIVTFELNNKKHSIEYLRQDSVAIYVYEKDNFQPFSEDYIDNYDKNYQDLEETIIDKLIAVFEKEIFFRKKQKAFKEKSSQIIDLFDELKNQALRDLEKALNSGVIDADSEFLGDNYLLSKAVIDNICVNRPYKCLSEKYRKDVKNLQKFI